MFFVKRLAGRFCDVGSRRQRQPQTAPLPTHHRKGTRKTMYERMAVPLALGTIKVGRTMTPVRVGCRV